MDSIAHDARGKRSSPPKSLPTHPVVLKDVHVRFELADWQLIQRDAAARDLAVAQRVRDVLAPYVARLRRKAARDGRGDCDL